MKNLKKSMVFTVMALIILISSTTSSWAMSLPGEKKFKDVKSTDWFISTVTKLVNMGGIDGYPDNTFKPNNTITAEEFIKITIGSLGYNEKVGTGANWAVNYINKAVEIGLIDKGEIKETEFNKPICRNRMAKILVKAIEHRKEEFPGDYKDYEKHIGDFKSIPEEYKDYVLKAYSRELLAGSNSKGDFKGDSNLTRAEAATVIIRIYDESERVNVKDVVKKETPIGSGPNVDLWKVPIKGEGKVEIRGPQGDDNPHNVDFSYLFRMYNSMPQQYEDAENLLIARFGKDNKTVKEIIQYIKSKDVRDKELKIKNWTINNQLISVSSDQNSMNIDIVVWRAK